MCWPPSRRWQLPASALTRHGDWNLDCRFSWKTDPETASTALEWLAPYVGRQYPDMKVLVGYAHHEYAPRPHLFWVEDGRWELEDLNPNDDWTFG